MTMNSNGGGGGGEGEYLGAGAWMDQSQDNGAYNTSIFCSAPNSSSTLQPPQQYDTDFQPYTQPTQSSYPSPQMQSNPYYLPPRPAPTYAEVASTAAQRSVQHSRGQLGASNQMQQAQRQRMLKAQRAATARRSYQPVPPTLDQTAVPNVQQREPDRLSYAQVVAGAPNQTPHTDPMYGMTNGSNSATRYGSQQLDLSSMGLLQLGSLDNHAHRSQRVAALAQHQANVARGIFDQYFDFSLYEEANHAMDQHSEPWAPHQQGVQNLAAPSTQVPTQHSRHLMSPSDSVDTSSVTSSRRSRAEIKNGNAPFKCGKCGDGFYSEEGQTKHEKRAHMPDDQKPFPCITCGYRFVFRKDMNRHWIQVHGDRQANAKYWCPYTGCEYATKGFPRKDNYNRHLETHRKADSAIQMSRSTSTQSYPQF